jgi:translation initiation factor IF-1
MPKNTKGGSGHKKQKNKPSGSRLRRAVDIAKRPKEFEVYGRVLRSLGNRRMEVYTQIPETNEYQTITCRIRGSLRTHMAPDDYVLVQLFDFNIKQGQIADVYSSVDVDTLIQANLWDMTNYKPDVTGKPYDHGLPSSEEDSDFSEESEQEEERVQNDDVI